MTENNKIEVPIGEILGNYDTPRNPFNWFYIKRYKIWGWKKLEKSLEKDGYNPNKFGVIRLARLEKLKQSKWDNIDEKYKYGVLDGNHRLKILKEKYNEDYKIEVIIDKENKKPDKWESNCDTWKINTVKNYIKNVNNRVQIVNTIKVLAAIVFMIGYNLKYLGWLFVTLIAYLLVVRVLKYLNFNPHNIHLPIENVLIKQIIMTLISNIPQLTIIIPLSILSILIILNGPLKFLIFGIIIYVCEVYTGRNTPEDD